MLFRKVISKTLFDQSFERFYSNFQTKLGDFITNFHTIRVLCKDFKIIRYNNNNDEILFSVDNGRYSHSSESLYHEVYRSRYIYFRSKYSLSNIQPEGTIVEYCCSHFFGYHRVRFN